MRRIFTPMLHPDSASRRNDQSWCGITNLYTIAVILLVLMASKWQQLCPYLLEGPTSLFDDAGIVAQANNNP